MKIFLFFLFKVWLLANKNHIPDYDELMCENYEEIKVS